MFDYTKNNHFKWGWGDQWYNDPTAGAEFKLSLGQASRPVECFRKECVRAAGDLADSATKPIVVGFSGGTDSQVVCLAMTEAGVEFTAAIASYYNSDRILVNQKDVEKARRFCTENKIAWTDYHIGLGGFYRSKGLEYSGKYGFGQIETLVLTELMDLVCPEHCLVMAEGFFNITPYDSGITPNLKPPLMKNNLTVPVWWQDPQPLAQHMINNGYQGTSCFLMYSPEILVSFFDHPLLEFYFRTQDQLYDIFDEMIGEKTHTRWKLFEYFYKPARIINSWPEIAQGRKYTGFEEMWNNDSDRAMMYRYKKLISSGLPTACKNQAVISTVADLIAHLKGQKTKEFISTEVLR